MQVESLGGAKYFVTFNNDASGFRNVYFLRIKSDVFDRFKEFEKMMSNKLSKIMKILRIDRGMEYMNKDMKYYFIERGIALETTAPYRARKYLWRDARSAV